jgi:hypothetical protein
VAEFSYNGTQRLSTSAPQHLSTSAPQHLSTSAIFQRYACCAPTHVLCIERKGSRMCSLLWAGCVRGPVSQRPRLGRVTSDVTQMRMLHHAVRYGVRCVNVWQMTDYLSMSLDDIAAAEGTGSSKARGTWMGPVFMRVTPPHTSHHHCKHSSNTHTRTHTPPSLSHAHIHTKPRDGRRQAECYTEHTAGSYTLNVLYDVLPRGSSTVKYDSPSRSLTLSLSHTHTHACTVCLEEVHRITCRSRCGTCCVDTRLACDVPFRFDGLAHRSRLSN